MKAPRALTPDPVELERAIFNDAREVRRRQHMVLSVLALWSLVLLVALFVFSMAGGWHFDLVWRYEVAALMGASVGVAELLSRYRDAPSFVLLSGPGIIYVTINAGASLGAMGLILAFGWRFGTTGAPSDATQVLTAGFGAMALFRSSLLTIKAGDDDVGIGPSSVLSIIMAAADSAADRLGAADRAGRVHDIMSDVSYERAAEALPTVSVALMQNLGASDIAALNIDLGDLKGKALPDETKAFLLGLKITNVVSTAVLAAAKHSLGGSILTTATGPLPHEVAATAETLHADLSDPGSAYAVEGLPQTPQTPSPLAAGRR